MNLQELIDLIDHIVCDNGYRLRDGHPSVKMPNSQPTKDDEFGNQTSVLAAAHKRGLMAIRNGHERINGWCKRNNYRTIINVNDI